MPYSSGNSKIWTPFPPTKCCKVLAPFYGSIFPHVRSFSRMNLSLILSKLYVQIKLIRNWRVELLKIVVEQFSNGVIEGIKDLIGTHRDSVVKRITVLLLILYLFAMVNVGRYVFGDLWNGLHWTSWSYTLFPIPTEILSSLPVEITLNPIEAFIYLLFIGQGIWVAWMSLGVLYIMMPLVRRGYSSLGRFNSEPKQKPSVIVEPVGLFTRSTSVLTVLLSTVTFIFNLAVYGPLLLSVVLGLSIVVLWILFVKDRKVKVEKPKEGHSVMLTRT